MQIRRVITGGCSFSANLADPSWIYRLEEKVRSIYPDITFRHTGFNSQGQELIQKKISLALVEELQNYNSDEILVLPMWSGTERKTFYIDNKLLVQEIAEQWPKKKLLGASQFSNLKNLFENIGKITCPDTGITVEYNKDGGWYVCNYTCRDSELAELFFNSMETIIGFATYSLENIIFLQNLCKISGVKIYHSFFRSYVYEDFAHNKDHLNLKYLYSMLDHDMIISTTGIYEYLKQKESNKIEKSMNVFSHIVEDLSKYSNKEYFEIDNMHPSTKGSQKWVDEVLFPKLQEKGIF